MKKAISSYFSEKRTELTRLFGKNNEWDDFIYLKETLTFTPTLRTNSFQEEEKVGLL